MEKQNLVNEIKELMEVPEVISLVTNFKINYARIPMVGVSSPVRNLRISKRIALILANTGYKFEITDILNKEGKSLVSSNIEVPIEEVEVPPQPPIFEEEKVPEEVSVLKEEVVIPEQEVQSNEEVTEEVEESPAKEEGETLEPVEVPQKRRRSR